MFQDHSKIPDASAIDQFKKFSLISILMSLFGLVIFYPTGLIGIVCMIRTVLLAKHETTKKILIGFSYNGTTVTEAYCMRARPSAC